MKIKNKIIIISIISISVLLAGVIAFNVLQNKNITVAKVSSDNDIIYDTIVAEGSYSADPKNPENILKGINRHIVKVKVLSVGESEYLPKTEYYNNPYRPCTPIEVEVIENLYGDEVKLLNNKIYISGGKIRLSDLEKRLDEVDISRLGLDKLSNKEKETKYMKYETEFNYEFEEGKEYVMIIAEIGDGLYKIVDEGCGVFTEDDENLVNVLSDVKITKDVLVQKADENKVESTIKVNNVKGK